MPQVVRRTRKLYCGVECLDRAGFVVGCRVLWRGLGSRKRRIPGQSRGVRNTEFIRATPASVTDAEPARQAPPRCALTRPFPQFLRSGREL